MNINDILAQAQGGNGLQSIGAQFGLSPAQTQAAIQALLPAFNRGLQQTASSPQGLGALLTMLAGGQNLKGTDAGNGILGQLFGSKDLSRAVAAQASLATGIGTDILKKMLPVLATTLLGGMAKQTNQQLQAGTFGASNPLGEIIEQMMRQGQGGAQQRVPQPAPQSNNPLGDILGQILKGGQQQTRQQAPSGSGNPLEDILGQILRGGGQQQQQAPQGGNNPLGDILDQIMKGGRQSQSQPDYEQEQEPPVQRRTRQPQQRQQAPSGSGNPLEDIFGKMFNPGGQGGGQTQGQAPDPQYQQGIDNIFEQFRRGVERYQR